MVLKNKRHIFLPLALAIYAIAMAVIGYPNYKQSGNLKEFWIIIGVCLAMAVLLHFVLKRREKNREKFKK
ncbi:hypothetical protein SDC9_64908 [bioreactor metagenome]|uniref:Uncharacterized protein n=1 Tax=bioreactor metagenome TaxID=1076179 RepID=A0A644XRG3_9ZZZZ